MRRWRVLCGERIDMKGRMESGKGVKMERVEGMDSREGREVGVGREERVRLGGRVGRVEVGWDRYGKKSREEGKDRTESGEEGRSMDGRGRWEKGIGKD